MYKPCYMPNTLIFTATYNEADNIAKFLDKLLSINSNLNILIIDDNSPDKTYEIIEEYSKKYKNIKLILRDSKLGLDTAHKYAYTFAKKNNYEKLITMDADMSHDPDEIPKMIKILDDKPFVIGSRYVEGGKCEMSIFRLFLSVMGNRFIKYISKINSEEFTTSFRGFNLNMLTDFDLNNVRSKGYSFFMESIFNLDNHSIKIHQIPIYFKNRTQGKSKIPKLEILRTLKNLFILKYFRK